MLIEKLVVRHLVNISEKSCLLQTIYFSQTHMKISTTYYYNPFELDYFIHKNL